MAKRKRLLRSDVRLQVLDAALKVFAERGFDGASMDHVAAEAGFAKGVIYSNFAGKDDLFLQLLDRQVEARLKFMNEIGELGAPRP